MKRREIRVGNVGIGGDNPIRIQSMTTSNTRDVEATVDQIVRLSDAGCEIARVTVQGMKEAHACGDIKNALLKKGYEIPLVADIHFYPPAAMEVVQHIEKVRINPGNFVDRRASFKTIAYDDATYQAEIAKIEEKFSPLVEECIRLKRAMRIGTNHGSLSDRIMNRYGDTPFGMVESALEFARVCRKMDFHNFCFSMKASNPLVMIEAYRLLYAEMEKIGWDYPLHLGVTEAGEGEDGRIKSAIGIGSLLLDGIGDTIRVSLTEDPWQEIDPCKRLITLAKSYRDAPIHPIPKKEKTPIESEILHRDGTVFLSPSEEDVVQPNFYEKVGGKIQLGQLERSITTVDALLYDGDLKIQTLKNPTVITSKTAWENLLDNPPEFVLFQVDHPRVPQTRVFFQWMREYNLDIPVLLHFDYACDQEDFIIQAAAECGSLLCDNLGSGVALTGNYPIEFLHNFSFALLQAVRMRTSKTEFISCPGCGRTLFDLQEVSKRIREKTAHLPGVKIAIMGCIVNGPGEMADADFGYVGSRPGKIDIYVGKTCVEKNIDFDEADERLIELIKAHDRWVEPELTSMNLSH